MIFWKSARTFLFSHELQLNLLYIDIFNWKIYIFSKKIRKFPVKSTKNRRNWRKIKEKHSKSSDSPVSLRDPPAGEVSAPLITYSTFYSFFPVDFCFFRARNSILSMKICQFLNIWFFLIFSNNFCWQKLQNNLKKSNIVNSFRDPPPKHNMRL